MAMTRKVFKLKNIPKFLTKNVRKLGASLSAFKKEMLYRFKKPEEVIKYAETKWATKIPSWLTPKNREALKAYRMLRGPYSELGALPSPKAVKQFERGRSIHETVVKWGRGQQLERNVPYVTMRATRRFTTKPRFYHSTALKTASIVTGVTLGVLGLGVGNRVDNTYQGAIFRGSRMKGRRRGPTGDLAFALHRTR